MSLSLQRIFARHTGFLRGLKAVYVINNFLNAGLLKRNRALYNRFGLRKSIFSPVSTRDFEGKHSADIPWIDQPNALEQLPGRPGFDRFDAAVQAKIKQFITDGYLILEGFAPQSDTDALNEEVDRLLHDGKAGFNYTGRKIFNLVERSELADQRFFRHPEILKLLHFLMGKKVIPFQTMNFRLGSEQRPHSDLIHMTTEPQGYLIATWFALESCTNENGPLIYYPGSHRLPFVSTDDYDSGNGTFTLGGDSNARYEDKIAEILAQSGIQPKMFLANRGDVLIWHANLIHGGSPITGKDATGHGLTRKSMVCHYFTEEVICYHEMSHRPALINH